MRVRDVMTKKVITLKTGSTLIEAAKVIIKNKISGAPVVDAAGKPVGIVSEKDLFKALYPSHAEFYESPSLWVDVGRLEEHARDAAGKPIDELMTRDLVAVNPDTPIMHVGSIMLTRGVHRVIVTGQDGNIVGIVSRRDIFHNIFKRQLRI